MTRRCEILGIPRGAAYRRLAEQTPEAKEREELIKKRIDFWHVKMPYLGARKISKKLEEVDGICAGRKLVTRYMSEIGIKAMYPKQNLSMPGKNHPKASYLLSKMSIYLPNQVWAVDITYIPLRRGHMYLTAVIDWHSRYIVGWKLSDTLESAHVVEAVENAIAEYGVPGIINSDQGSQFTSLEYRQLLKKYGIRQSMDGKGRWIDNVIIERWFRSLKVERIYINECNSPKELRNDIADYIAEYNNHRPHQSMNYRTPHLVYFGCFEQLGA